MVMPGPFGLTVVPAARILPEDRVSSWLPTENVESAGAGVGARAIVLVPICKADEA